MPRADASSGTGRFFRLTGFPTPGVAGATRLGLETPAGAGPRTVESSESRRFPHVATPDARAHAKNASGTRVAHFYRAIPSKFRTQGGRRHDARAQYDQRGSAPAREG